MERTIYIKLKMLVNGMLPLKDKYGNNAKYEEFDVVENTYNPPFLNISKEEQLIYLNNNLVHSIYSTEGVLKYITFDSTNYIEIKIEGNIKSESARNIIFEKVSEIMLMFEKKIRLVTNISINLPVCKILIYDEQYKYLDVFGISISKTVGNSINNYDENTQKLLINRFSLKIETNALEKVIKNNSRFKRALEFYNKSFDIDNINIRFTLVFSALESLFNVNEGQDIVENIAKYSSKILFLEEEKERKIYCKLKDFYNRRSRYIHGDEPLEITKKTEFDLREIVREILIIYWYISISKEYNSSKQIINYIENNTKDTLDTVLKTMISSMQIINYKKYYKNIREKIIKGDYDLLKGREIFSSKNITKKLKE